MRELEADPVKLEHTKPIKKVVWTDDGRSIITGCEDGVLRCVPGPDICNGPCCDISLVSDCGTLELTRLRRRSSYAAR